MVGRTMTKGWDSCSHWLNWQCSMTFSTAREKLRVAHCLEQLPKTNQAFEAGELSYSKVRAITRVATDDNENILLEVAMGGTASHLDKLVRRYQQVDEAQNPIEQVDESQQRKLDYYQDREGMWILHARLPQVEGGLLIKAIEEIMRQQGKNAPAEAHEEGQNEVPTVEKASYSQKRADALDSLAEHYIATATVDDENGSTQALAGHERCQVVLHLSVDGLDNCNCERHTPPNIDHQWISMANAKRFSSDASLYTVLDDKYGNVLNVGRKTRTVGTALKRALNMRDETCRFPGCCANKYVDFHHVRHWADGGETEPDNLIKLCRFHHDELHKGHYTIALQQQTEKNHGQKWIFKTADDEVMEPNPTLPMPVNKDFVSALWTVQWPNINSRTGVSGLEEFGLGSEPRCRPRLNYSKALKDLFQCK